MFYHKSYNNSCHLSWLFQVARRFKRKIMTLNEEANEKPAFLDYQQKSTRVFYHPQNTGDSVYPTNQEYVVVNPEAVKDSRKNALESKPLVSPTILSDVEI